MIRDDDNYPRITIVKEDGTHERYANFFDAQKNNMLRYVVGVMVENEKGEWFVQKRSEEVHIFPGRFSHSVGGHVDEGMTPEEAAKGELSEEIGLKDVALTYVGSFRTDDDATPAYFELYVTHAKGGDLSLNDREVAGGRWLSVEAIASETANTPEHFVPAFCASWREVYLPYLAKRAL